MKLISHVFFLYNKYCKRIYIKTNIFLINDLHSNKKGKTMNYLKKKLCVYLYLFRILKCLRKHL